MPAGPPINSGFKPAWWLGNAHLQTLYPYLFRRTITPTYRDERLELPDGDFVDLCWSPNPTGPIIIVLHGLEGSIHSPYAAAIMAAIHGQGWRGVFMHFRGCGGTPNRRDRGYHSGDTGDIEFLIQTILCRYRDIRLGIIGYSLGGNVMLKYLGTTGTRTAVTAAVGVSVPYVLEQSATRLSKGLSRIYQYHLLRLLRAKLKRKFSGRSARFDSSKLCVLDTFYKFDDMITAPLHGFAGADDYYQQSSSRQYIPYIRIPTLLIHAQDDPFLPPFAIPDENELPANVTLELSMKGGHVGFVGGAWPGCPEYWLEQRIIRYLGQYVN